MSTVEEFDAIVVGSGFGGAVAAHQLAKRGKRVCLLERGAAHPPGTFPRDPAGMARSLWIPKAGHYGMFDVWLSRHTDILVSSGLGGGSLIYANVLLRKPASWFTDIDASTGERREWPVTRVDLDPHYDAVESMLSPQRFPYEEASRQPVPSLTGVAKADAMRTASEALPGSTLQSPPLAVTFTTGEDRALRARAPLDQRNRFDVARSSCYYCGECDVGCNGGAKNTLDLTYLSDPDVRDRLHVETLANVRQFAPCGRDGEDGWEVLYESYPARPPEVGSSEPFPRKVVRARVLVLAAGTLGSTLLLLRGRAAGRLPKLSGALGQRFNGNGDALYFVRRTSDRDGPLLVYPSRGPVITSSLCMPDELDADGLPGQRGFLLQDGGYAAFMNWLFALPPLLRVAARAAFFSGRHLADLARGSYGANVSDQVGRAIGPGISSSRVLPLLAMGREPADGVLRLTENSKLDLDINKPTGPSGPYYKAVRQAVRKVGRGLGGSSLELSLHRLGRYITVHPLGGCPMSADDPEKGVVDNYGRVYGYRNLHVVDGSVMPGAVGVNPSLTIAAFAHRAAEVMLP